MTLTSTLFPGRTLLGQAFMVLLGTLFIAIAAQISVPMYPSPMTLQTLAILTVGYVMGSRMGAVTLLAYLAEGAMGLPVFTGFNNGAAFVGPTAGFLVGFVGMAYLAGLVAERGVRNVGLLALAGVVISALLYIPGTLWPLAVASALGIEAGWVTLDMSAIMAGFVVPFLIGDVIKAVIAAMIVSGAWGLLKQR